MKITTNKFFTNKEILALSIIFLILVIVSIPNFTASLRRSRDQIRRDDLGALVHSFDNYFSYFGVFPLSSEDGKILGCLNLGGEIPYKDKKGTWIINLGPCGWGKDPFGNLATGEKYFNMIPEDPSWQKGRNYFYRSNGKRYQIFAAMEGKKEAEVDIKILEMNLTCGTEVCNVGRSFDCDFPKSLEQCEKESKL